jgi:MFS family permease
MRYRINDPREARRRAERRQGPSPLAAARQIVLLARSNPQIGILFALFVVSGFAGMLTWSFASVYIREELHLSLATLGMVTGLSTLAMLPANLLGGLAADRLGRRLVLVVGLTASTCQFLLLVYARSAWHLALLFSLGAAAQALLNPASQALMADIVPSDQRGTFLSVMNSGGFLLTLPAPVLGAFLWDHVGPTAPFWAGGALLMAATVVTIFLLKEPRARPSETISAA